MTHTLYALDFDGVICDSAVETSITAWKACQQIWQDMPDAISIDLIDQFRQVRPALETGYEAILIIRLLFKNVSAHSLLENYSEELRSLREQEGLTIADLKQLFGSTRDHWIVNNADEWLKMNPLFDGIRDKLGQINTDHCYIITTKQERFVHQILAANDVVIPKDQVFGLDRNMNKQQVLSELMGKHPETSIVFVEDRLPTLINVLNTPQLAKVKLYFANWGYNTAIDKQQALKKGFHCIDLMQFSQL